MAKKISAGILPYRFSKDGRLEVYLVHPGGPFWAKKDDGAWSVAKGEVDEGEDELLSVALREFTEETGVVAIGELLELEPVQQPSKKMIHTWAVAQDIDPANFVSNHFEMEWPKGSGAIRSFPEVDRVDWFNIPSAKQKILPGQVPIIDQLVDRLNYDASRDRKIDSSGQSSLF
jgi:predicted NUDIX family NTP pyrophosphohydrolase